MYALAGTPRDQYPRDILGSILVRINLACARRRLELGEVVPARPRTVAAKREHLGTLPHRRVGRSSRSVSPRDGSMAVVRWMIRGRRQVRTQVH